MKGRTMKVHERILLLRWVLPSLVFLFVLFYQLVLFRWVHDEIGFVQHSALEIVVYGIVGPLTLYLALTWVAQGLKQKEDAERRVRERERFLANITATSAEAIVSLDSDFLVSFWNQGAQMILGYTPQQMLGQTIEKLFLQANQKTEMEEIQTALDERGLMVDYETMLVQRNGEPVPVEMTITPMLDEQDQLNGYSMLMHNISLRKRREKMLTEERKRIAGEIHDSFAQDLYSITLKLDVCQKLIAQDDLESVQTEIELIRSVLKKGLRDVRRAIFALQPIDLEEMGLESSVRHLLEQYKQLYQLALTSEIELRDDFLPKRTQIVLFRTLQECLNNIVKHAHADQVYVQMISTGQNGLSLTVKDDGQGFLPDQVDTKAHLGLEHMKEQIRRQGGQVCVKTELGAGTSVNVTLPVHHLLGDRHGTHQSTYR